MQDLVYPAAPAGAGPESLTVSVSFRQQVGRVIGSISLFIVVYLLLIIAAIALAIGCCWLGIALIMALPKFITLMIGLGLMALGISVFVFLVKFIFAVSKDENPKRIEITEDQHPNLFAFIRRLTKETNTPLPKKIYISPDVNAAVFYNSSFWSMFLPVRKNLEIGLGLVNSINISEFKAVMAHEFGHFSQRSMKLGSFTYNVNRVIHNMLYENNSYTSFLSSWAGISGYMAIFAGITVKIAQGIQWILKGMYSAINKNYLGLSREMEFHADAVAASVSGGNNLVTALSRIEVAGNCYANALQNADERFRENKVAKNIFANQLTLLRSMATEHRLPVRDGLPEISYHFIESFSRSRINFRDQWASHPSLKERKEHLDSLGIDAAPDTSSAWILFEQPHKLQEMVTLRLYHAVTVKEDSQLYDNAEFDSWFLARKEKYGLPEAYKGFYDRRFINIRNWDPATAQPSPTTLSFEEIFNDDNGHLQSAIDNNKKDLETLTAIREKKIDVSSFDFDGAKYTRDDCEQVEKVLQTDIDAAQARLQELDKTAFLFFLHRSKDPQTLRDRYVAYMHLYKQYEVYAGLVNHLIDTMRPLYTGGLSLDQVNNIVRTLKITNEPAMKEVYTELIYKGMILQGAEDKLYDRIMAFSAGSYGYFHDGAFANEELDELRGLAVDVAAFLNEKKFARYKKLLEDQLSDS